jgi:hypothetical protein
VQNELWSHRDGDALARLCALGAAAFASREAPSAHSYRKTLVSPALEKLCFSQSLMPTTVTRSLELCTQLKRVLARLLGSDNNVASDTPAVEYGPWSVLEPPRDEEVVKLRQIMMSSYVDCIARKAPIGTVKTGSRRRRLTAYLSCDPSITEPIYIHPHSNLYKKDPTATHPEYVIFSELMKNTAGDCTYMSCVTAVNGLWIPHLASMSPLLQLSPPLESPAPHFDAAADCVMCYVVPTFGIHKWEFPAIKKPMQQCFEQADNGANTANGKKWSNVVGFRRQDEFYRWFARLLLEGHVLHFSSPQHRDIWKSSNMKESPSIVTSMKPVALVSALLEKLITHKVYSRATLKACIIKDPSFLCNELEKFLQLDARKVLRKAWSTIS